MLKSSRRILSDPERRAPVLLESGADEEGKVEPSHFARYHFALPFIELTDTVLDLPCGTGYGSKLLASRARAVVGADVSEAAIGHAQEFFAAENVSFVVSDAERLSAEVTSRAPFTKIVSFEGIEHVPHPDQMLASIKSVLAPDGTLIISTPRKPHGSPHHIIEFSLEEYESILVGEGFALERMYGQVYTDIYPLSDRPDFDFHALKRFNFIAVCHHAH